MVMIFIMCVTYPRTQRVKRGPPTRGTIPTASLDRLSNRTPLDPMRPGHSHGHHVDLRFREKLNDLLVRFPHAHGPSNLKALARLLWNQFIEMLSGCRYGF